MLKAYKKSWSGKSQAGTNFGSLVAKNFKILIQTPYNTSDFQSFENFYESRIQISIAGYHRIVLRGGSLPKRIRNQKFTFRFASFKKELKHSEHDSWYVEGGFDSETERYPLPLNASFKCESKFLISGDEYDGWRERSVLCWMLAECESRFLLSVDAYDPQVENTLIHGLTVFNEEVDFWFLAF